MAVTRGDIAAAVEQYQALKPTRATALLQTSIDRILGLLAQTVGRLDEAATHFEDALGFCRKAGYQPEYAWACHDYAEALLVGARHAVPLPGGPARAFSLLDEGLSIASGLGMRPLMDQLQGLQEKLTAQPMPAPIYPNGLTQREVEVLRLIAAGQSNSEIAAQLFISPNTVAHHITSILNKTGAANRTRPLPTLPDMG
jgi:DNA-binding CsgD family transcriptional regulator